jgi:hypothetical protein
MKRISDELRAVFEKAPTLLGIMSKPMKLRPLKASGKGGDWGKRDEDLSRMVLRNMVDANPPIVIQWSIHEARVKRCLRHNRAYDMLLEDLSRLVPERFGTSTSARGLTLWHGKSLRTYPDIFTENFGGYPNPEKETKNV